MSRRAQARKKTRAERRLPASRAGLYARSAAYGTRNRTLLESAPLGVSTWTLPVVALTGAVVEIALPVELTVNADSRPPKVACYNLESNLFYKEALHGT
jgi:hypothetical protein